MRRTDEGHAHGRLVFRAYSPLYDTAWSQQWDEQTPGELVTRVGEIAGALESAVPQLAEQVAEAERRAEERKRAAEAELRAWRRQERARARAEARQKSVEELRAIAEAWRDAHALEAFFEAVGRRAETMDAEARAELQERIGRARTLLGSEDVIDRFLKWRTPSPAAAEDEEDS